MALGNVTLGFLFCGSDLAQRFRIPRSRRHEDCAILAAKAFRAAHRPKEQNRQHISLAEGAWPGAENVSASAIVAMKSEKPLEPRRTVRSLFHFRPPADGVRNSAPAALRIILCLTYVRTKMLAVHGLERGRSCNACGPRANVRRSRLSHINVKNIGTYPLRGFRQ